jgi:uncharacterized protein (DUF2345 family)
LTHDEAEGIKIYSKKDIKIKANEEINISGKTVYMSAGSKIDIQCKGSEIEING